MLNRIRKFISGVILVAIMVMAVPLFIVAMFIRPAGDGQATKDLLVVIKDALTEALEEVEKEKAAETEVTEETV